MGKEVARQVALAGWFYDHGCSLKQAVNLIRELSGGSGPCGKK